MKNKILLVLASALFAFSALAWVPNGAIVTIDELWGIEDTGEFVIRLSSGDYCYITQDEQKLYALLLTLHMSGKRAMVHCHDNTEAIGGVSAHRVHRVVSSNSN